MLAKTISKPLSNPLEGEIIVLQSKGMERWVSLELARKNGICSNYCFPFPNAFLQDMFSRVLADKMPDERFFDVTAMTWRIMGIIPEIKDRARDLENYLKADTEGILLYQLSSRLANLFDLYTTFRPAMVIEWLDKNQGQDLSGPESWQPAVWKRLCKGHEKEHRAALRQQFFKELRNCDKSRLPQRVSVFGISYIPEFYLEVLQALSQYIEVNIFFLNPSKEYWADIQKDAGIYRAYMENKDAQDLHLEAGNTLLASMGRQGAAFLDALMAMDCDQDESFEDSPGQSMLAHCQNAILHLNSPVRDLPRMMDDKSIRIHSCHSPMREVEVLYDNILDILENNKGINPRDIIVMSPDITQYAPCIRAVFDRDPARIPFSIADQRIKDTSVLVKAFLHILDLAGGRYPLSEVMVLLDSSSLRRRFHIDEAQTSIMMDWAKDTGIRWGLDKDHKKAMGLPQMDQNTWKAGIERLVLGYAMTSHGQDMFKDILPYDDMEGQTASALGCFLEFTSTLFEYTKEIEQPRRTKEWAELLSSLLDTFFDISEDEAAEAQGLRAAIKALDRAEYDKKVSKEIIHEYLDEHLCNITSTERFLSKGITFCSMLPMRSIPSGVVCMLGMNNDTYPRKSTERGFDLMVKNPKRGDPSKRDDDLYLFLEALLSAKHILYISYTGQGIRDNAPMQPCVLVSALMDYINSSFTTGHIFTRHGLQAFSPAYFLDSNKELFSYSKQNLVAAQALVNPDKHTFTPVSTEIATPGDESMELDVGDLERFFKNPARFLLTQRLGMHISDDLDETEDTEPLEVNALDKYWIKQDVIERSLERKDQEETGRLLRAQGRLPHGAIGSIYMDNIRKETKGFVEKVSEYRAQGTKTSTQIDLKIDRFSITGYIRPIDSCHILRYRHAKLKAKDMLGLWIEHLILCASQKDDRIDAVMIGSDKEIVFKYQENAQEILYDLLEMYWKGLISPLSFFPKTSWGFFEALYKENAADEKKGIEQTDKRKAAIKKAALKKARTKWNGGDWNTGEAEDTVYRLCYPQEEPLDQAFIDIACLVYGPLCSAMKEKKGPQ